MGNLCKKKYENPNKKSYYELLKKNYKKSFDLICNNIGYAFIMKKFNKIQIEHLYPKFSAETTWLTFLLSSFNTNKHTLSTTWKDSLYDYLLEESFLEQFKFQNKIFFREIEITLPKMFKKKGEKFHTIISEPVLSSLDMDELKTYKENKSRTNSENKIDNGLTRFRLNSISSQDGDLNNNDIIDNDNEDNENYNTLAMSWTMESNTSNNKINNIDKNEYNSKYLSYKMKKYLKLIRQDLEDKNHPITKVIKKFINDFKTHFHTNLDYCKNNKNDKEKCDKKAKEIIKEIKHFIEIMQVSLKLFYSKSINFENFIEEKDEIINLITYILFNDKTFYKQISELLQIMNEEKMEIFKKKLAKAYKLKPKDLGIKLKFCLDEESEKFWEENKDIIPNKNKEMEKQSTMEEEISTKSKERDLKDIIKVNANDMLSQNDDESKSDISKCDRCLSYEDLKKKVFGDKIDTQSESSNINNTAKEKIDIKKKLLNDIEEYDDKKIIEIRNKLEIILPDEEGPYSSVIKYLKKIKSYKAPLEKLIIISYLSVLIIDEVDKHWESKKAKLPSNFLNIDADDIMSIYLYIINKSNDPSLLIDFDFIKYFTTSTTKQSVLGYYFSTFEGCLKYIEYS